MKVILIGTILSILSTNAVAQHAFIVQEIPIHAKFLERAIDEYIKENNEDLSQFGVLVVKFDPTISCYYLTHKMFDSEILEWMPSYYSLHRSKIVVFYTGFENNLNITPDKNKNFISRIDPYLADDSNQLFYHAPIWKVRIKATEYTKELVDSIPLPY